MNRRDPGKDDSVVSTASDPVGRALRIVDDVWSELRKRVNWDASLREVSAIPHVSEEDAVQRSERAKGFAASIDRLDLNALPHELRVTVRVAAWHARNWTREAQWYWTAFNPSGSYVSPFAPTAYCGAMFLNGALNLLQRFTFEEEGDLDRYLALVADFRRLIDEFRMRTAGQALRNIYMPRAQLEQAIPLLQGLKTRSLGILSVAERRLQHVRAAQFSRELERRLHEDIAGAFDEFIELLGPSYAAHVQDTVGLSQYPDGAEIYADLVRQHTTLDLTPKEVHEIGLERMARVREDMKNVIAEAQFSGDAKAYYAHENADPRWRSNTAEGVEQIFQTYIDRIKPKVDEYFFTVPKAQGGVAPLPDALAASMTFGYYEPPTPERDFGTYFFNARNLTQRGLMDLGALIYHELIPGHHLHLASQLENDGLHPLRMNSSFTAFVEGWAEYAASVAGEMGMYELPAERFGRLISEVILACRLVVDTGTNALGWSLSRAREYMRENTFLSDTEIHSETLRYSADIPGQSLAYKIGEPVLMRLRKKMHDALGDRFDIRSFHEAILRPGTLPFVLVEEEIDRAIEQGRV